MEAVCAMSLQTVKEYLRAWHKDGAVREFPVSSATVERVNGARAARRHPPSTNISATTRHPILRMVVPPFSLDGSIPKRLPKSNHLSKSTALFRPIRPSVRANCG